MLPSNTRISMSSRWNKNYVQHLIFPTNLNNKVRRGQPAKEQNCRAIIGWFISVGIHRDGLFKREPGRNDQLPATHQACCASLFTTQPFVLAYWRRGSLTDCSFSFLLIQLPFSKGPHGIECCCFLLIYLLNKKHFLLAFHSSLCCSVCCCVYFVSNRDLYHWFWPSATCTLMQQMLWNIVECTQMLHLK